MSSAFQAQKIAPSSVARAVWCGSALIVDGNTEWSGAQAADGLVWIAARGYGRRAVTAMSTPTRCLPSAYQRPCVSSAQMATSSGARAVWGGSGVIVDGKTEWHGCRGRAWPRLLRGDWLLKKGCSMRWYANVLLAAKGPCVCSALQALQIATSSVARAVWCGSGVAVDGKTEWSGA